MEIYERAMQLASTIVKKLGGNFFRPSLEAIGDIGFETELSEIKPDINIMRKENMKLNKVFPWDEELNNSYDISHYLNVIPYIADFQKIIPFAFSFDGMWFCFDFRCNDQDPSVIWWDDDHWVRVAHNTNDFINLFVTDLASRKQPA